MIRTRRMAALGVTFVLLLVAWIAVPTRGADPSPASGSFAPTGSLDQARSQHTANLLPDGRVLVVGGQDWNGEDHVQLASAELWDPATQAFAGTGSLVEARAGHTATLLHDGRVLVAGGPGSEGILAPAELRIRRPACSPRSCRSAGWGPGTPRRSCGVLGVGARERPEPVDRGLEGLDGPARLGVDRDVDADGPALPEGRELRRHEGIGAVLVDGVLVAHHRRDLGAAIETHRDAGHRPGAAREPRPVRQRHDGHDAERVRQRPGLVGHLEPGPADRGGLERQLPGRAGRSSPPVPPCRASGTCRRHRAGGGRRRGGPRRRPSA